MYQCMYVLFMYVDGWMDVCMHVSYGWMDVYIYMYMLMCVSMHVYINECIYTIYHDIYIYILYILYMCMCCISM